MGVETCHGKNGNGTDPSVPSLAGQGSAYLQSQLAAFQAQRRVGVVSGIAMNLASADIRNAAVTDPAGQRDPYGRFERLVRGRGNYDVGIAAITDYL